MAVISTLAAVANVVKILEAGRKLWASAGTYVRKPKIERYATPHALHRAIVRGEVLVGQTVRVTGYISRYAHLYRPISFVNHQVVLERGKPRTISVGRGQMMSTVGQYF